MVNERLSAARARQAGQIGAKAASIHVRVIKDAKWRPIPPRNKSRHKASLGQSGCVGKQEPCVTVSRSRSSTCALGFAPAAQAAVQITIDKSAQLMTVERDGRALYQWPVSTGKAGFDTPSGKFKAFRMERDHYSREWDDAPMPFSIFFTQKGHAIHGIARHQEHRTPGVARLRAADARERREAVCAGPGRRRAEHDRDPHRDGAVAARRRWRSSARRMRAMCSRRSSSRSNTARATARTSRPTAIRIMRSRSTLSRSTRNHSTRSPIRAAAVWPAHLRPAAIRAAAAPGLCRSIRPAVPAPGHALPLLAPAPENLWTRHSR